MLNARYNQVFALIVGMNTCALVAACQKENIKVNGTPLSTLVKDGASPLGLPINLPGALQAARTFFQTRGVVSLTIASDEISASSSFELLDTTTGSTLMQTTGGLSLDNVAHSAWEARDLGYDFTLNIYPLDPNFSGKFAYGVNDLKLDVDVETAPKTATRSITMQDFNYLAPVSATFASNVQQQENFEGEVVTITGPFVSNGNYEISNGFSAVVDR